MEYYQNSALKSSFFSKQDYQSQKTNSFSGQKLIQINISSYKRQKYSKYNIDATALSLTFSINFPNYYLITSFLFSLRKQFTANKFQEIDLKSHHLARHIGDKIRKQAV